MAKYDELLTLLGKENAEKAESLREEIDIMIHKLKFLPAENFPAVMILSQKDNLNPSSSENLREKVTLAGGILTTDLIDEKPDVIIILQHDDSLYSDLPQLLQEKWLQESNAYLNNRIYILEGEIDDDNDICSYLRGSEVLAEILQPKYFYFGHEGTNWNKFDVVTS